MGVTAAASERRGWSLPVNESWIAACCLARELPLATLNVKDYAELVEHEGLRPLRRSTRCSSCTDWSCPYWFRVPVGVR